MREDTKKAILSPTDASRSEYCWDARMNWAMMGIAILAFEICIAIYAKDGFIRYYLGDVLAAAMLYAYRRVVEEGRELPLDIKSGAILHAGPIIRKTEDGGKEGFEMVSVGPTTSMRMEKFEREFIAKTGVRLIVGKGGMGEGTMSGCREFGAIHCVFPAGCAVVAATQVEEIESADWMELGMPETLWKCRVKEFGPLIVSIDAHGNNLFEQNKVKFNEKKDEALAEILPQVGFIK